MLNMLDWNVTIGQNVTVWEEERHETSGKNVTEGTFCHNPGKKKGDRFSQLHYDHPWGWVDVKSLDVSSGDDLSQWM